MNLLSSSVNDTTPVLGSGKVVSRHKG